MGEEGKKCRSSKAQPCGKGIPLIQSGGCEGSDRSSDRRPRWEKTRRAIPERPGSGRSTRRGYGEDFPHESTGVVRRAGITGRGHPRFRASPDDRERERTRHRGGTWNRTSPSDSDSSQRRGRWHRHPPKHLPNLELYSGREP